MNRRSFLQQGLALTAASGLNLMGMSQVQAATGYRALVCILLQGGNDGNNMILPLDTAAYNSYKAARTTTDTNLVIAKDQLVALDAQYAVHPSMSALKTVWDANALTAVLNVGTLSEPMTRDEYRNAKTNGKKVPESLYSHSDQQDQWQTGMTASNERTGWGGRLTQQLSTGQIMSVGGNNLFSTNSLTGAFVLPGNVGGTMGLEGYFGGQNLKRKDNMVAAINNANTQGNLLLKSLTDIQKNALTKASILSPITAARPGGANTEIDTAFSGLISGNNVTSNIAQQLYQIAKLIKNRAAITGNANTPQIFFAAMGGYDTHDNQLGTHANLLKDLGDAMAAFYKATVALGVASDVTTFTHSDFGRTLKPNSSNGSDHAWGNHQFVMGGSVKGKTMTGNLPVFELGGPDDVGTANWEKQGRWVPKYAASQMGATLAKWYGASPTQVNNIFPELAKFPTKDLGFML